MTLYEYITKEALDSGLTLAQFCKKNKLSYNTINRLKTSKPRQQTYINIAKVLGVKPSALAALPITDEK